MVGMTGNVLPLHLCGQFGLCQVWSVQLPRDSVYGWNSTLWQNPLPRHMLWLLQQWVKPLLRHGVSLGEGEPFGK